MREFDGYLRANADRIPNYGERRRAGEAISTAFVESTVNQESRRGENAPPGCGVSVQMTRLRAPFIIKVDEIYRSAAKKQCCACHVIDLDILTAEDLLAVIPSSVGGT
ncbi:MAG: hypothetical protein LC749_05395 [Actinobacteria bacterium]|nr:hypothetical protein [Actinomycetota bacterium]